MSRRPGGRGRRGHNPRGLLPAVGDEAALIRTAFTTASSPPRGKSTTARPPRGTMHSARPPRGSSLTVGRLRIDLILLRTLDFNQLVFGFILLIVSLIIVKWYPSLTTNPFLFSLATTGIFQYDVSIIFGIRNSQVFSQFAGILTPFSLLKTHFDKNRKNKIFTPPFSLLQGTSFETGHLASQNGPNRASVEIFRRLWFLQTFVHGLYYLE